MSSGSESGTAAGRAGGGRGDRDGGRGRVVEAAGTQGQFQCVQEWRTVEAGAAAVGVRRGAVAGVEAGGEVVGATCRNSSTLDLTSTVRWLRAHSSSVACPSVVSNGSQSSFTGHHGARLRAR